MILDQKKVSELLAVNKEEEKMEHEYKSHNNYIIPNNRDEDFFKYLYAFGLVDRNNNKTGSTATAEQLTYLSTSLGMTSSEITSKLDRLQISTCEQTGVLKDTVYNSSIQNLVGQNAIGEKITNVGYMANSNAKDIEKTSLLDGSLTRKNSDDNFHDLKNSQTTGFSNTKDAIYGLSTKTSAEHCDIKGLIKDNKYEIKDSLCNMQHSLTLQATMNQSVLMSELAKMESNNALRDKDAIIRDKDDKIQEQQFRSLKEDNVEIKKLIEHAHHGHGGGNGTNIEILSDNFSRNIASNIGSQLAPVLNDISRGINIVVGNTANLGRDNKTMA